MSCRDGLQLSENGITKKCCTVWHMRMWHLAINKHLGQNKTFQVRVLIEDGFVACSCFKIGVKEAGIWEEINSSVGLSLFDAVEGIAGNVHCYVFMNNCLFYHVKRENRLGEGEGSTRGRWGSTLAISSMLAAW
ncbi:unnamed protein product [Urochloa humidicola]